MSASIIVTHDNSDFDAIASMVAASKLRPDATMVLGRRVGRVVRDFLALHKDHFVFRRANAVDLDEVRRWTVVDVRRGDRLRDFQPLVERCRAGDPTLHTEIYDHHAATRDDLVGDREVVEPTGAAVTLLIRELRAANVDIDPIEATLLALGIYADTGAMTWASTTSEDVEAVAWLLRQGASLRIINHYMNDGFAPEQRDAFARALAAVDVIDVGGFEVGFAAVELQRAPSGLGEVATHLLKLHGMHALFALFRIREKNVQVIARASARHFDVGALMRALGGGGHRAAAAALVRDATLEDVRDRLESALQHDPPRPRVVGDIMSSPVRSLPPDTTLAEARRMLAAWRHTGVPVLVDGELRGILSRRDVQKAEVDQRLHLPVSSCMAHHVHTTRPDASLESALAEMVDADIGRLPVLDEGRLVGIITRSDLIRVLYDGAIDALLP